MNIKAKNLPAYKWPLVLDTCGQCDGDGLIDIAHHGSPEYEKCRVCKGKGKTKRDMTIEEKLDYIASKQEAEDEQ